jgi:hypothetical protein
MDELANSNTGAKKCPLCAEMIQLEARVCRFCGARFLVTTNGYCTSCHSKRVADEAGGCSVCRNPLMDGHVESKLIGSTDSQEKAKVGLPELNASSSAIYTGANSRPETYIDRQPPKKSKVGCALWILGILVVIVGAIFIVFYFTGGAALMKPVETVTFDTIAQYQKERLVRIEGSLKLPSRTNCDDSCGLQLVDYDDPDKVLTIFVDVSAQNGIPEPHHMLRLSYSYEMDALKVGLSNGGIAGNEASVILTGRICETTTNALCLHVDQVEQGSIPPTPTPTLTPVPTATPRPTSTPLPVNVDFSNVCSHVGAPVIIQGRIGSLPMFMFCSRTCSLTLKDIGGSGKVLDFDIVRGSLTNQMEGLHDNYQDSDLIIHTNDGQIVGVGDLVVIQGLVSKYDTTSDTWLGCQVLVEWIKVP